MTDTLQQKKPFLLLRLKSENPPKDSYLEALASSLLTVTIYNQGNYKEIIDEFLGYAGLGAGQGRYNIILDKKSKYYLDWAATKYKKSRSGIIKELVQSKMAEDKNFAIYLKNN